MQILEILNKLPFLIVVAVLPQLDRQQVCHLPNPPFSQNKKLFNILVNLFHYITIRIF